MIHCKRCKYYIPPDKCNNEKGCKVTHPHCYCPYSKLKDGHFDNVTKTKEERNGEK